MPITKGLPYGIFMKKIISDITEQGQLHQIIKKYEVQNPNCSPLHKEGKSLSLEKLTSVFIIVLIGVSISLIILIFEKRFHTNKTWVHVSNRDANKMKLQKLLETLNNDEDFLESTNDEIFLESTVGALIKVMQRHNAVTNDTFVSW